MPRQLRNAFGRIISKMPLIPATFSAILLSIFTCAAPLHAEKRGVEEMFGHKVQLSKTRLTVDGRVVVKGLSVWTREKRTVNGVGALIGFHYPAPTSCAPTIFVVSFPKDQAPSVSTPKKDCSPTTYEVEKDAIRFFRSENYKPKTWTWTPETGMSAEVDLPVPNQFQRFDLWQDLAAGRVDDHMSLFTHPQMKDVIKALIGKDKGKFDDAASWWGDVVHKGGLYVLPSCAPHVCSSGKLLFVLDTTNKRIFVAGKSNDDPLVVLPSAEQWTPQARAELDAWMKEQ